MKYLVYCTLVSSLTVFFFHDILNTVRAIKNKEIEKKPFYNKLSETFTSKKQSGDIFLLGDSILFAFPSNELSNCKVVNYSIPGETSKLLLDRLDSLSFNTRAQIFIMIGVNDIGRGVPIEDTYRNIKKISEKLATPNTTVTVSKVLRTNYLVRDNEAILKLNTLLEQLSNIENVKVIDFNIALTEKFSSPSRYTSDGLHLTSEALQVLRKVLIDSTLFHCKYVD